MNQKGLWSMWLFRNQMDIQGAPADSNGHSVEDSPTLGKRIGASDNLMLQDDVSNLRRF
jgi:hypothetical protein